MSTLDESQRLHQRARAFVSAFEEGKDAAEPFDALACDLARFQAEHVSGYAKLIARRKLDPASFATHLDPPAVPTDAFRMTRVSAFAAENDTPVVFRTSGTTHGTRGTRGTHYYRDVATYDAAALAFGRWALLDGIASREPRVLVLGPSPEEASDSSLTYMLQRFVAAFDATKGDGPVPSFFLEGEVFDVAALDQEVATALVGERPVLLLGTSFAFVHFLDAIGDDRFRLPAGSRVMLTGGFKGKSREVSPPALRRAIREMFTVEETAIVNEYGMTELSSQFYDGVVHGGPSGVYVEPPWARVTAVDPETLAPVPDGEVGIARITDLMNVDSAAFVLTADRVRRVSSGFELLGRLPGAPPRGCSIAIDEMLEKSSAS